MLLPDGRSPKSLCSTVITKETILSDGEAVTLYGIKVLWGSQTVAEFSAITENYEKIRELCILLNENDIDKKHINYIIEDFTDSLHFI